ncbi:hypothetical protein ElyMa_002698300 [Elysia marginata]|uniref:Uncharacterized protein n=1 Tax=Elysia marginata TaxID=1093978 RepID=A0AAV4HCQ9_9GAST|nr:hypothetical protein ElyMa_002698300 [Elysia marginata]
MWSRKPNTWYSLSDTRCLHDALIHLTDSTSRHNIGRQSSVAITVSTTGKFRSNMRASLGEKPVLPGLDSLETSSRYCMRVSQTAEHCFLLSTHSVSECVSGCDGQ